LKRVDEPSHVVEVLQIIDEGNEPFYVFIAHRPQAGGSRAAEFGKVTITSEGTSWRAEDRRQIDREFSTVVETDLNALRRQNVYGGVLVFDDANSRGKRMTFGVCQRLGVEIGYLYIARQ
jgi:hypothetical protein